MTTQTTLFSGSTRLLHQATTTSSTWIPEHWNDSPRVRGNAHGLGGYIFRTQTTNKESPIELLNDDRLRNTFWEREWRGTEKHLAARWDSTNYHHGISDIYRIKQNGLWPPFSLYWTFISYHFWGFVWKPYRDPVRYKKLIARMPSVVGNQSRSSPFPLAIAESNSVESSTFETRWNKF